MKKTKIKKRMPFEKALKLRDKVLQSNDIMGLFRIANMVGYHLTDHGPEHARQVKSTAQTLTDEIVRLIPQVVDKYTRMVIIPIAAFLHDVGRIGDDKNHHLVGARFAKKYLSAIGFDSETVRQICRIIANHRSAAVLRPSSFRSTNLKDAAWAIVVIADKAVGDEERVPPKQLKIMRKLRRENRIDEWSKNNGDQHFLVNFAIKSACLSVEAASGESSGIGSIILQINIDTVVCQPSAIYKLYHQRFHACAKAAQYLGFAFRLQFNGVRYVYSKETGDWKPATTITIPVT